MDESRTKYHALHCDSHSEDSEDSELVRGVVYVKPSDKNLHRTVVYLALSVFAISSALLITLGYLILIPRSWQPSKGPDFGIHSNFHPACSNDTAQALSEGCVFDPMSFCWLPQQCFDDELSKEFLALEPWSWYLDEFRMEAVPAESVAEGRYEALYVSWRFHLYHCTYMWRKMHRALLSGGQMPIDSYIANYTHTAHCEHVLTMENMEHASVRIARKFVGCGVADRGMDLYHRPDT